MVTLPGAGSALGGTASIVWTGFGGEGTVGISLSTDGGLTFPIAIDAAAPNSGSYMWDSTVEADGPNHHVRITGGERTATSSAFAIDNTAPVATVIGPSGGGLVGPMTSVTWSTADANVATVEIAASANSGATYDIPIEASVPDTGVYTLDTSGMVELATYRIRIIATDAAGNASVADTSDADFSIDNTAPVTTVVAPMDGDVLSGTIAITWTTVDANPGTMDILLSRDGGTTYAETIAAGVSDTGTYSWQSGEIADSTSLRLLMRPTDLAGKAGSDAFSSGTFTATNLRLRNTAEYRDVDGDSEVSAGDEVLLRFDKDILVNAPVDGDFVHSVVGDSFGAGATYGTGPGLDTLLVTLGANPSLTTRGVFDGTKTAAGSSSGLELANPISTDAIEAAVSGIDAISIGPVDVSPLATAEPPLPVSLSTPRRGDVGDIDQDGDLDIVLGVEGGDPSEVWLNDGDHGWTLAQSFDTDDTQDVAFGDVDGDGYLDVVTATSSVNRVWINNGSGVLLDSGQAIGSADTRGVVLGDFDLDGDLDAYFGNALQDRLWTNNGSGVFADSGQSLGSDSTVGVDAADLDRDGDLDVFAAHTASDSQVWINDDGVFGAGGRVAALGAQDVELGDFDGDSNPDVYIAVAGASVVYLNDGTGAFATVAQALGNGDNRGVALLDLDGDSDLDAIASKNLDGGRLWINDGAGAFEEGASATVTGAGVDVLAGRFDGDADVDFFMVNDLGAHVPYRGSAAGGQAQATFAVEALGFDMWHSGIGEAGDLDGDGVDDIIVPDQMGATHVLLGDGDGGFTDGASFGAIGSTGGDLFDADGDGDLDYLRRIGAPGSDADQLWINGSEADFTDSGLMLGVDTFAAGDLDGDGDADLVVVTASALETWDGNGEGAFAPSGQALSVAFGTDIFVTDMDGDGDPDVLATSATSLRALRNDGTGAFSIGSTGSFSGTSSTIMADLDRDGDDDILFASSANGTALRLVRNNGSFAFVSPIVALANVTAFDQLELHDVDEDGNLDLLAIDRFGGNLFVALGNGDGTFQAGTDLALPGLTSIALLDVDGDGDMDAYASKGDGAAASDDLLRFK